MWVKHRFWDRGMGKYLKVERSSEWRSSEVQNVFQTGIQTPPER
jgi:hypothetical protein